jgi:hypothetical protein
MSNLSTFNRLVTEAMSIEGMTRIQAERAVVRKYPAFAPSTEAGTSAGGSAEAQLNALAKRIASERRIPFAQAYVAALNENPALYVAYLREHETKLGALRG